MSISSPTRGLDHVALIVAVCLVAANMRGAITAVGPLLEQIQADTGVALATLGLLTSIPLVTWAVVSPLALTLSRRFGLSVVLLSALILVLAATIIRSLLGIPGLWAGTVFIGIGLAILNVLMPALVKRDFPNRIALMTGVYTALLAGVGAIASGVAVPLSSLGDASSGWRIALLITGGALLPFAMLAWLRVMRRMPASARPGPSRHARSGIWTDRLAWLVALYMGVQSCSFFMLVTWLATMSMSFGRSEVVAGLDVMVYQLASLGGSLGLPFLLRVVSERIVPFAVPVLGLIGTAGLFFAPGALTAWVLVLGVFSGASLSTAMTLIAHRARDIDASTALSGMAQSVGYALAACAPLAFGWLHTELGGWGWPMALLAFVIVAQAVVGLFVGQNRYVLDGR